MRDFLIRIRYFKLRMVHYLEYSALAVEQDRPRDSCVRQDSCTRQGIYVHKNFGWAKMRRQAPSLPHGSYATAMTLQGA